MPELFLNSATIQSMIRLSKSSPPSACRRCRDDLNDVVADLEDRDVERAAAEVVDAMISSFFLSSPYASAAAVGSLTMRFTSSPAMRPASWWLALRVVEVRRDRDDRFGDLLAEVVSAAFFSF